jgi:predicted Zn finger-like uncharacterized protein
MKISCQSCQAKYTIADDKVLGKIVKIRCKKCGATIVVDGHNPATGSASGDTTSGEGTAAAHADERDAQEWTVNVAEGDQRTMKDEEVIAAYRSGTINEETYCWRDGMADWAALAEIPALLAACVGGAGGAAAVASSLPGEGAVGEPAAVGAFAAVGYSAVAVGAEDGSGVEFPKVPAAAGAATTATPVAARRAPGARAPIADLFGSVAQAGGEDDVMTSAPAKLPQPDESHDPQKLTGARNENSVLFSLSSLTGKSQPPPRSPDSEASGLIDIRQLSAQLGSSDEKRRKSSRVDDIMNLTGGSFTPDLTAPVLSAPTIEPLANAGPGAASSLAPGGGRNKGVIFLAVAVGALVIVGAVGGAMTMMHKDTDTAANASAVPSVAAKAPASAAPEESASAASAPSVPSASASAPASEPSSSAAPAPEAKENASAQAAEAKAKSAAPAVREAPAAPKAAPPPESDQPFNMGEAKARLGAAADAAQSCKKGDVTGTGHVVITFAPSGGVQSVALDPPFEGTPAGTCVAAHFRGVHVPPFAGSPFKVRKSFTIN